MIRGLGGKNMVDLIKQAESVVDKLMVSDEQQLFEQLGIRALAISRDPAKGSSFDPRVTYDQSKMGLMEDVIDFGKRLFSRWNEQAYKLICGSDPKDEKDREELLKAFNVSDGAIAAALSTLLVTHLGLAPAIAVVIAVLVIKRFVRPTYKEFCDTWKKKLEGD